MLLLLLSFIAGFLTVLAPCILPLLPVIIGGSLTGDSKDRKRPLIIVASLAVSLIAFTLLLKATTLFINIPPSVITAISGGIIVALGILLLIPNVYANILAKSGIEHRSQALLGKGFQSKQKYAGPILIGAALGPVFSSCSPVYAYILATVLPVNFTQAIAYMVFYILGLSLALLLIAYFGQRFVSKLKFATDPRGWFQRTIAILFIIVGLLVATGYDKRLQTYVSTHTPFNFDAISAKFIPSNDKIDNSRGYLNTEPYPAPELTGLQDWINSDPQTLQGLKGKVVYVDFWTYSCINCIRNNPYIEGWYQNYKDDGFTVLGLHAPEFAFERNPENVRKAVVDQKLTHPVALDNDFETWNAFKNNFWPAGYLIDKDGQIRRVHYGEGEYKESELAIRDLLKEAGKNVDSKMLTDGSEVVPGNSQGTPETYLGLSRASDYVGMPALGAGKNGVFIPIAANELKKNQWTLGGKWDVQQEKIVAGGDSVLRFNISAKEIYVVAGGKSGGTFTVNLNGQPIPAELAGSDVKDGKVIVNEAKLYRLVKQLKFTENMILELVVEPGVDLSVFTFGS